MTSVRWRDEGPLIWQCDRPLSVEQAEAIIRARFPAIDTTGLRHIGYGWEFDAFLTADGWVFRFPRRADWSESLERGARVVELVEQAFPPHIALPRVELRGAPTLGFPYAFAGHRFIEGVAAHEVDDKLLPTFARDIATFLGALHSIPTANVRPLGLPEIDAQHVAGAIKWRQQVLEDSQRLRGLDPVVDRALVSLARERVPLAYFRVPLQLIHADLGTDHILVDPSTRALRGVIDWSDAQLGDAARDFVFLPAWRGWGFVEEVLRHYPRTIDAQFRARLRWMARLLSVFWLQVAHDSDRDFERHLESVRNVFARDKIRRPSSLRT